MPKLYGLTEIIGGAFSNQAQILNVTGGATGSATVEIQAASGVSSGNTDDVNIVFRVNKNNGAPFFAIKNNGSIGINPITGFGGLLMPDSIGLTIAGRTSDSSTQALRVIDSSSNPTLAARNDRRVAIGGSPTFNDSALTIISAAGTSYGLTIPSSGDNAGFGTSAPSEQVHIVGNLRYVPGSQANGYVLVSDANGVASWTASTNLAGDGDGIYDGSGTVPSSTAVTLTDTINFDSGTFYIDGSNNNVGMGTTTPTAGYRLEAVGNSLFRNSSNNAVNLYRTSSSNGFPVSLNFDLRDSSNAQTTYAILNGGIVDNTAGSEFGYMQIRLRTNGAMNSPTGRYNPNQVYLHLGATSSTDYAQMGMGTDEPFARIHIDSGDEISRTGGGGGAHPGMFIGGTSSSSSFPMNFYNRSENTASNTRIRFWGGTVDTSDNFPDNLGLGAEIRASYGTRTTYGIFADPAIATDLSFYTADTSQPIERMRILSGGNVGIGVSTPDAHLHVSDGGTEPTWSTQEVAIFQKNSGTFEDARVAIIADDSGNSIIDFGDSASSSAGQIDYSHADNEMIFNVNSVTTGFIINSLGVLESEGIARDTRYDTVSTSILINMTAANHVGIIRSTAGRVVPNPTYILPDVATDGIVDGQEIIIRVLDIVAGGTIGVQSPIEGIRRVGFGTSTTARIVLGSETAYAYVYNSTLGYWVQTN